MSYAHQEFDVFSQAKKLTEGEARACIEVIANRFAAIEAENERLEQECDVLRALLAEAKAGWDSAIADLFAAAEICRGVEAELDALPAQLAAVTAPVTDKPKIVCLCGSTRFTDEMLVEQWQLTKQGCIVVSWCAVPESYFKGPHIGDHEGVKEIVDEVHKRKIDLADEVYVLNIGGYIGESTRSEINYAEAHGKPVRYREPIAARIAQVKP